MFFDYTITDADAGRQLDPADGFIVNLSMSIPPIPGEQPAWDPLRRIFTRGWFTLRGLGDDYYLLFAMRNMISYEASANPLASLIWRDASEHYRGKLLVEAVPRQSVWLLTLSDIPNVRTHESFDDYLRRIAGGGWPPRRQHIGEARP